MTAPLTILSLYIFAVVNEAVGQQNLGVPPPEPWYGDFLGRLNDPKNVGIQGEVYVINDTSIQVRHFSYNGQAPDLYFWLDQDGLLTSSGIRLNTFQFGSSALGSITNATIVLNLPADLKIPGFRTFGLWCQAFSQNFGSVAIPEGIKPPKADFLPGGLDGKRYKVGSGPILIMDRRTIKIYGFTYDGKRAPDGFFFAGRGEMPTHGMGVKVAIRGRDKPDFITAMKEVYDGGKDIIVELPQGFDVYNIDWISVFCYRFRVDFGHVMVRNISTRIPPYVPEQQVQQIGNEMEPWPITTLLGKVPRLEFTFQLGPPGKERGYQNLAQARPSSVVWYVNGYMTPELFLQRGTTYTFVVEGGENESSEMQFNPLYISDDPFGGYSRLSQDDRKQITLFAGVDNTGRPLTGPEYKSMGRLCVWSERWPDEDADKHEDFMTYRETLRLTCQPGNRASFTWTPDSTTPDIVYYQSYTNYYMGWKIMVVDEIPMDLPDFTELPYLPEEMAPERPDRPKPTKPMSNPLEQPNPGSNAPKNYCISILHIFGVFFVTVLLLR